jgi:DeoR/GlpR family transcriptional regulator of sugar metabolism
MIDKLLQLISSQRLTVPQLAEKLGTTKEVVDQMLELLDRKGKIIRINTSQGTQIRAAGENTMSSQKLTPSILIEYIKSQGFSTISSAATALNTTPEEIRKMLDYLFTKQHVKKVDVAKEHNCAGNCSGCHGCEDAAMIQIDGTTICYQLKAHNL